MSFSMRMRLVRLLLCLLYLLGPIFLSFDFSSSWGRIRLNCIFSMSCTHTKTKLLQETH